MSVAERVQLIVITHPHPACGRPLTAVVAACVQAGATAIQLRDKSAPADRLLETADRLRPIVQDAGAAFIVNDRVDVALAAGADGVHLGPEDLPPEAARRLAPAGFLIGFSTDHPETAAALGEASVDYFGVGAVFGTASKPGLEDERIGLAGLGAVVAATPRPCVGIGGINLANAGSVLDVGAGVAVLSAVMGDPEPATVVRGLSRLLRRDRGSRGARK